MNVMYKPARAGMPLYNPSPAQEKPIREGLSFLSMTACFWSNILYSELALVYTKAVPIAATDSYRIFINADEVIRRGWTVENIAFLHGHEAYHYIRGDLIMHAYWSEIGEVTLTSGRKLPYRHRLMNAAADYVINAGLIHAGIGTMPPATKEFPKGQGLFDPKYSADGMNSSLDVYEMLWDELSKEEQEGGNGEGGGWGDGHGNFDIHLKPSDEQVEDEVYGNGKQKRELAVVAAAIAAEAAQQGTMPGFLKRILDNIMQPKVRWEDQLEASVNRCSGSPGHDWAKFNKRMICRPDRPISFARRVARGAGTIVVGADTSGSTVMALDRFFAEMGGIAGHLQPRDLYVMWCDTEVHRVDHIEDPQDLVDLHRRINESGGPGGGGGSDMRPIFNKIAEMGLDPDMLVVLTDLHVTFPAEAPRYETIWCSTTKGKTAPFGKTIHVEL